MYVYTVYTYVYVYVSMYGAIIQLVWMVWGQIWIIWMARKQVIRGSGWMCNVQMCRCVVIWDHVMCTCDYVQTQLNTGWCASIPRWMV